MLSVVGVDVSAQSSGKRKIRGGFLAEATR